MYTLGNDSLDVMHAAATDACVLLSGDPSVATPLAQHIHRLSARRDDEFVILDCDSPADIIEERIDEWFGAGTRGRRRAHAAPTGGTVFLKEVGRLHARLQRRLVAALGNHRLTGRRRKRLIASTAEPLTQRVREGTFDDKLFYRLNVIHLVVTPDQRSG